MILYYTKQLLSKLSNTITNWLNTYQSNGCKQGFSCTCSAYIWQIRSSFFGWFSVWLGAGWSMLEYGRNKTEFPWSGGWSIEVTAAELWWLTWYPRFCNCFSIFCYFNDPWYFRQPCRSLLWIFRKFVEFANCPPWTFMRATISTAKVFLTHCCYIIW